MHGTINIKNKKETMCIALEVTVFKITVPNEIFKFQTYGTVKI
jgi:hypothetical protein